MATFEEAKNAVMNGKKTYRLSQVGITEDHWTGKLEKSYAFLCVFGDDTYRFQREDHQYKLMAEDFEAKDWVIQ